MRKIALLFTASLVAAACYEDKGNYDYAFDQMDEIEEVTLNPTPKVLVDGSWEIELDQSMDEHAKTETITLDLKHKFQDRDNFVCTWYRTYSVTENGTAVARQDTLTGTSIDFTLPANSAITYNVKLKLTDTDSDLEQYYKLVVKTKPPYKNSLLVLHGAGLPGTMKLSVIDESKVDKVIADAWERMHPEEENPFASACLIYDNSNMNDYAGEMSTLYMGTYDGDGVLYNAYGLNMRYPSMWMYPEATDIIPSSVSYYNAEMAHALLIAEDGRFYISGRSGLMQYFKPGADWTDDGTGTQHLTEDEYRVTHGILYSAYALLWDADHNRFLSTNYSGNTWPGYTLDRNTARMNIPVTEVELDFSAFTEELRPDGKAPVFFYIKTDQNTILDEEGYLIFKNDDNELFFYNVQAPSSNEERGKYKVATAKKLENITWTPTTQFVYYGQLDASFFLYTEENNLYRYNTQNNTKQLVYSAPANYTITRMKFRSPQSYFYGGELHRILDIALSEGNKGAVTTIQLNNGGGLDSSWESPLYEGFEHITDISFAHNYIYAQPW